jgi:hypothetical protein
MFTNINIFFKKNKKAVILAYRDAVGINKVVIFEKYYELFEYSKMRFGNTKLEKNLILSGVRKEDIAIMTISSVADYFCKNGNPYSSKGFYLKVVSSLPELI